ncbi:MAG: tetratricopeptide repeat protein [Desulfovibrionales bacterium]|nr:tetratricopeptide repeat protein [Desulfovibrionales bacterium]
MIQSKITWYKEVLELDPGSKVFFPLARLLVQEKDLIEAVSVLKTGLERHPEHFEARLLLLNCLEDVEDFDQITTELGALGEILKRYPSFWKIWAGLLSAEPGSKDAALAMTFLAATFDETPLTWRDVIDRGLQACLDESAEHLFTADQPHDTQRHAEPIPQVTGDTSPLKSLAELEGDIPLLRKPEPEMFGSVEGGESISDRTLSMAQILAEQGDLKGALEICDELTEQVTSREELEKITELREDLVADTRKGAAEPAASVTSKDRIVSTLEALAERLEARAS